MAITKINKIKQSGIDEELPSNYYDFFEKKAAEARIVLKNNPISKELLRELRDKK